MNLSHVYFAGEKNIFHEPEKATMEIAQRTKHFEHSGEEHSVIGPDEFWTDKRPVQTLWIPDNKNLMMLMRSCLFITDKTDLFFDNSYLF